DRPARLAGLEGLDPRAEHRVVLAGDRAAVARPPRDRQRTVRGVATDLERHGPVALGHDHLAHGEPSGPDVAAARPRPWRRLAGRSGVAPRRTRARRGG